MVALGSIRASFVRRPGAAFWTIAFLTLWACLGQGQVITLGLTTAPPLPASGQWSFDAGAFYSFQLSASGGATPYTYSVVGNLPPGMTIDAASGTISGSPTT